MSPCQNAATCTRQVCIDVVHLVDETAKYCSEHFQAWCSSDMQNDKIKPTTQEEVLFTAVNATIQFQANE